MELTEINFDDEPINPAICEKLVKEFGWNFSEYLLEYVWCIYKNFRYLKLTLDQYFEFGYNKDGYNIIPFLTIGEIKKEIKNKFGIVWRFKVRFDRLSQKSVLLLDDIKSDKLNLELFLREKSVIMWENRYDADTEIIIGLIGILVYEKNK